MKKNKLDESNIPDKARVWRLNILPDPQDEYGRELIAELETKMKTYGRASLGWTCGGNYRARWQTQSAIELLGKIHPDWIVTSNSIGDSVLISAK